MKIKMNQSQFKALLQLVHLGNYFVNGIRKKDFIDEFYEVENLIFSYADKFNCQNMTYFDKKTGKYYPGEALDKIFLKFHSDFIQMVVHDELTQKLSIRDLGRSYENQELDRLSFDEYREKLAPFIEKYLKEFEKNGVDNLYIDKNKK